jgi:hypothetical protein
MSSLEFKVSKALIKQSIFFFIVVQLVLVQLGFSLDYCIGQYPLLAKDKS